MCKVYTGCRGTSEIEHGLCACTVDNPLAKARGLSLCTGAQTMLYLSHSISLKPVPEGVASIVRFLTRHKKTRIIPNLLLKRCSLIKKEKHENKSNVIGIHFPYLLSEVLFRILETLEELETTSNGQ